MPKYDVINRFKHPETGRYVDPPGPAELSEPDGQRLINAECLKPAGQAATKKAASKKAATKKAGAGGSEG